MQLERCKSEKDCTIWPEPAFYPVSISKERKTLLYISMILLILHYNDFINFGKDYIFILHF